MNKLLEVLMPDSETELKQALAEALSKAEERGDLVIATSIVSDITAPMAEAVKAAYAGIFTTQELAVLSNLVFQATSDKNFYDWEMPTLVGYTHEEMLAARCKAPCVRSPLTIGCCRPFGAGTAFPPLRGYKTVPKPGVRFDGISRELNND